MNIVYRRPINCYELPRTPHSSIPHLLFLCMYLGSYAILVLYYDMRFASLLVVVSVGLRHTFLVSLVGYTQGGYVYLNTIINFPI
ncbi:hypothetical protein GGR54DRAFT_105750 [Hypoxylon sp. NC1633]|nr:hypothetical protein GGR54DRAFT_105750 [Hypoxylon sp. NC1633]